MFEVISLSISVIALLIALATFWLTLMHRGKLCMTKPSVAFFGYDFIPHTTPKVFLRTLLYSTSAAGLVIESMYAHVTNTNGTETFSFWGYGETNSLVPGSGLFVGKTGIAVNHHFVLSIDKIGYEFTPGEYTVSVFARIVGRRTARKLQTLRLSLDENLAAVLGHQDGVLFELDPETQVYHGHMSDRPTLPPKAT